jgi:hypothetical protein
MGHLVRGVFREPTERVAHPCEEKEEEIPVDVTVVRVSAMWQKCKRCPRETVELA